MTVSFAVDQHEPEAVSRNWDRLWRHAPTIERDDELLDRERRSPRWRAIHQRLTSRFGSIRGLKTIELGSGRGDWSVLLAESGADVTLLDTSELALDQARLRFERLRLPAQYIHGDLFAPPIECLGAFDVVLSSGVIEHFLRESRTEALRAHLRTLNHRGTAVISVPNSWCPSYRLWKLYLELRDWWPYGVEIPFSRPEFVQRGQWAGFREIDVCGFGLWHSVGVHICHGLFGRRRDWSERTSRLDRLMGASLVFFGQRGDLRTKTTATSP